MRHLNYSQALVATSILACNFSRLADEVQRVTSAGTDWIHCDVMDGHFVDNISFGSTFVQAVSKNTNLHIDLHLMIDRPDHYLERFIPYCQSITSHIEAPHNIAETLNRVRAAGCLAGLALSPDTPIENAFPYLGQFDVLLIMTVHPGFGGQSFIPKMQDKIQTAVKVRRKEHLHFHIEVDGGINPETAAQCRTAGANVFVAGTAIFQAKNAAHTIQDIRGKGLLQEK